MKLRPAPAVEQRRSPCWRRDLNDAVRDDNGKFSFEKVGTIAGQLIAGKYLLVEVEHVLKGWDVMTILFTVLIAPSLFKKLMSLKYGGVPEQTTTTTTASADVVTTTKGKK